MMKEQLQALVQENSLLKRAVAIQHERQKEYEDRGQELNNLKQMVSQYQEQLRTLEVRLAYLSEPCFTFVYTLSLIIKYISLNTCPFFALSLPQHEHNLSERLLAF